MYFLLINFTFAFVELVYGIWTNSLGLITDSFHMFFDCSALIAGLIASVLARRPPNERFTYGYGRAQVIGGFVNGLFLIFVALFVLTEAIERFAEPPEVHHEHHLLEVSVIGLLVNFVGIFAFSHAHTHGGEPCDHGHAAAPPAAPGDHGHSHGGEACHGHGPAAPPPPSAAGNAIKGAERSFVLDGVLLHVIADTLGSVSVIISSLLIKNYGWMIADPICSSLTAYVTKRYDSSTSFFVNSRTLKGCTDPFRRGSAHPISVLLEPAASYLCYLMLTCTHSNGRTHSLL